MLEEKMEEQVLAERCRQGDNLAYRELYERCVGRMLSVCLCYTGSREAAQDLMRDGFLKLFGSLDRFTWRGGGSLQAWMKRIITNTVLQCLQKSDMMNQSAVLDDVPEACEEPDVTAVDTIPQGMLVQFTGELSVGHRTVFNLFIFEDKSHKEIARLLGTSKRSSASQLVRVKAASTAKVRRWVKKNA